MNSQTMFLKHLAFHGQHRPPAVVEFQKGLNVIYGASNTGKSFIVETIDFMLGGRGPLPDIPEINGYDQILLGIGFSAGAAFTVRRSLSGGAFELFEGDFRDSLPDSDGTPLAESHNEHDEQNLSHFLLNKIGLVGKRVRKNAKNETQSLSFRNLARLSIINEEEIIQKRSPLSDGNYTADTANTSVFKLLLTGTDDSALIALTRKTPEEQKREAQIELLNTLIQDSERKIKKSSGTRKNLDDQQLKLTKAMSASEGQLAHTEQKYKKLSNSRRDVLKRLEVTRNRYTEILVLLERFKLLRRHYVSDIDRLIGIKEAGHIFTALDAEPCPVCGAAPEDHDSQNVCDGDVRLVVEAAQQEIDKIENRENELNTTIVSLESEQKVLSNRLPKLEQSMHEVSKELDGVVSPDLRKLRSSYKDLARKEADVSRALNLFDSLDDLRSRKHTLEKANSAASGSVKEENYRLTETMVHPLSKVVEETLVSWEFPGAERVHFGMEVKDLVISGKPRTSFGKGLRAITQAAFTISLMKYCLDQGRPHPGFAVLDSPLLSYKAPDGAEDDLSGTVLNSRFYEYLMTLGDDKQTIVIENTDPPTDVEFGDRVQKFSGDNSGARAGLFPSLT